MEEHSRCPASRPLGSFPRARRIRLFEIRKARRVASPRSPYAKCERRKAASQISTFVLREITRLEFVHKRFCICSTIYTLFGCIVRSRTRSPNAIFYGGMRFAHGKNKVERRLYIFRIIDYDAWIAEARPASCAFLATPWTGISKRKRTRKKLRKSAAKVLKSLARVNLCAGVLASRGAG